MFFTPIVNADFQSVMEDYENQKYGTAYEGFLSTAKLGHQKSQFNLGVMYFQGQYVDKDINQAYAWMKLSMQNEEGIENQKKAFDVVKKKVVDIESAEKAYQAIEEMYSIDALKNSLLPVLKENSESEEINLSKIIQPIYPRMAALKGIEGFARFEFNVDRSGSPRNIILVDYFPNNVFVRESFRVIPRWKIEVKENFQSVKDYRVRYKMEYLMSKNSKTENSEKKLIDELLKNSNKETAVGLRNMAYLLLYPSLNKDNINPYKLFLQAAMQGDPEAQYKIGLCLNYEIRCEIDLDKSKQWLTLAANNGYEKAKLKLAVVLSKGNTVEAHKQALIYMEEVKEKDLYSEYMYAWMLVTSPYEEISNPQKAIDIINTAENILYVDQVTIREIKAAAYAALGNFEDAINYQTEALELAEENGFSLETIKEHLEAYQNNSKWF